MTRQRAVEVHPEVRRELPLLSAALSHVAHVAIRTGGTIAGSLAHADPSAELPAVVAALGGSLLPGRNRGSVAADHRSRSDWGIRRSSTSRSGSVRKGG
jgi:CO/xanthine dehydrogenase FAD-binding subunit